MVSYKKIQRFLLNCKYYFFILIVVLFFFQPIFKGQIPFPGDLLVGEYVPYNSNTYLGIAPGGVPNKGQGFDVLRMIFPWKEFATDSLKNGQIPLWNPYNFSGTPFLANFQNGFFYPLNLLFLLFSKLDAWTLYILSQPFLSALFTYLFLKELRVSKISSVFGGLVFAFSSYMVVWMEYGNIGHSIIWLPFLLFLTEKLINKKSIGYSIFFVSALTLSILAGYIQTSLYLFIFSLIYMLFRLHQEKKLKPKTLLHLSSLFILPVFISSIQLFPTIELFLYSAREAYSVDAISKLLIPPMNIVTIFAPDFFGNPATRNYFLEGTYIERVSYIGVIPILFFVLAIGKKVPKIFWFFLVSCATVLLLSFNNPISFFLYSFKIPVLSTGVPTRIMHLFGFSAAICSAIGFDIWLKQKNIRILPQTTILSAVYIILWFSVLLIPKIESNPQLLQNLLISKRNLILPTFMLLSGLCLLVTSRFIGRKHFLAFVFIALLLFEQFYFFRKITPFSPKEFFYPQTSVLSKLKEIQGLERMWGFEDGYMEANIQTHEKIFSTDGYDPLFIKRYAELVNSGKNGKIESVPRSYVVIPSSFGKSLGDNHYRDVLLDLLGVKFILNKNESLGKRNEPDYLAFSQEEYSLIYQKPPWQIYRNNDALPRFFLTDSFVVEKDKEKIISRLYDDKRNAKTVILEEDLNIPIQKGKGKVKLIKYSPNKINFSVDTQSNNILFMSDNFFPGWTVFIDDNVGRIYRANYSFRAVPVPKGKHTVIFSYNPKPFYIGVSVTLATIMVIMLYIAINRMRGKNDSK